jgi:hypothetical protein
VGSTPGRAPGGDAEGSVILAGGRRRRAGHPTARHPRAVAPPGPAPAKIRLQSNVQHRLRFARQPPRHDDCLGGSVAALAATSRLTAKRPARRPWASSSLCPKRKASPPASAGRDHRLRRCKTDARREKMPPSPWPSTNL